MIASIVLWLIRKGVHARFIKPLLIAVAFLAVIAILGVGKCSYDRSIIADDVARQNAKIAPVIIKAGDKAATDRSTDTTAIAKTEQEARNAIAKAPETPPSPAALALACDRLRRAGKDTSHHPACR